MSAPKNHIAYPRKQVFEVLRTLNELVVSLDQLGSAEMTKQERDSAVFDFIQRHRIYRKTAKARKILSEPFSKTVGADGMDGLEKEMQDIQYWQDRRRK